MAGRIPQAFIDDLIARSDIVGVIDQRVKLKRAGKNYSACCPFHNEKTPSFTVSPDKQFYYCFGCGASGNAMGFLIEYEHLSFIDAVASLAQRAGVEVPREKGGSNQPRISYQPLYDVLEDASEYYQTQLRQSSDKQTAVGYLKRRGLSGKVAKLFAIGYAPPGFDNLKSHLETQAIPESRSKEAGLLTSKENSNHSYDKFRQRIMFPIRDPRGRTIAFGGRVLGDDKPKYLNSPETPVFHKSKALYGLYEMRQQREKITKIMVVEGYMDVIALAQHGVYYAVATLGTATSTDHIEQLFRMVDEIVFCFDGDRAGRQAAWRAMQSALPAMKDGRQAKFLFLPDGEDPDSLVRSEGKELLEDRVSKCSQLSQYLLGTLSKEADISTIDGKAKVASLAAPLLAKLPTGLLKEMLIGELADMTKLSHERIRATLPVEESKTEAQPTPTPRHTSPPANTQAAPSLSPIPQETAHTQGYDEGYEQATYSQDNQETVPSAGDYDDYYGGDDSGSHSSPLEEYTAPLAHSPHVDGAIRLLLQNPRHFIELKIPEEVKRLKIQNMALLLSLLEVLEEHPHCSTAALLGRWHGTEQGQVLHTLAAEELLVPTEGGAEELKGIIKKLKLFHLDQKIDEAKRQQDVQTLSALLQEKHTYNTEE